jgi:hypothetical protein
VKVLLAKSCRVLVAFLAVVGTTLSHAQGAEAPRVEQKDCRGVQAELRLPLANVDPVVPDDFTIATTQQGGEPFTDLVILAARCAQILIGGTPTGSATEAALRVEVQDRDESTGELFHFYQLWFASDNRELIKYWRENGAETGAAVVLVENFVFELDPVAASGVFRFEAPAPTPSPFKIIDARLGLPVAPVTVFGDVWTDVPRGILKQGPERVDLMFGVASGTVVPKPGSVLDTLFCDDTDGAFSSEHDDSLSVLLSNSYTVGVNTSEHASSTDRATCREGTS